jgi:hypothetical protein
MIPRFRRLLLRDSRMGGFAAARCAEGTPTEEGGR